MLGLREEGRWGREREGNGREKRRDEKKKGRKTMVSRMGQAFVDLFSLTADQST